MKKLSELGVIPAPWKTDMRDDVEAANGIVMAYVSDTCELAGDEEKHNARLIAAAPELYEALKMIYECVKDLHEHHCQSEHIDREETCEDCKYNAAWLAKARAALEKAGGAE